MAVLAIGEADLGRGMKPMMESSMNATRSSRSALRSLILPALAALAMVAASDAGAQGAAGAPAGRPAAATPASAQTVSGPIPRTAEGHPNFSGFWQYNGYLGHNNPVDKRVLKDINGNEPPMLPAAKKIYDERADLQRHDDAWADSSSYCLPSGMPRLMFGSSFPNDIWQDANHMVWLFENEDEVRYIQLNMDHDPDAYPTWKGDSVGKWEGDTLVVDTIMMNDRTSIDKIGMPHSEDLHVIEHMRLLNKDTIEVIITIDDPKTFSKPWDYRTTYRRLPATTRINDDVVCLENQRNQPQANGMGSIQLGVSMEDKQGGAATASPTKQPAKKK